MKFAIPVFLYILLSTPCWGKEDPTELPVSHVSINKSHQGIVVSQTNQTCDKVTLNPQGINQEFHMKNKVFPLALLGWGCWPSENLVSNRWQGDISKVIYDFVQEQHGRWTITFANSNIKKSVLF